MNKPLVLGERNGRSSMKQTVGGGGPHNSFYSAIAPLLSFKALAVICASSPTTKRSWIEKPNGIAMGKE